MKVSFWLCFAFALPALAAVPDRYQTILDRNAFALRPIVIPEPKVTNSSSDRIEIKLSGFATIDSVTRAYFVVEKKDDKKVEYVALKLGERNDYMELLDVSVMEGRVNIKKNGVDRLLSLKDDGMKNSYTPGAPMQVAAAIGNAGGPSIARSGSPVYNSAVRPLSNRESGAGIVANQIAVNPVAGGGRGGMQSGGVVAGVSTAGGIPSGDTITHPIYNPNPNRPVAPTGGTPSRGAFPGELHNAPTDEIENRQMTREEIEARLRELRQQHGHPPSEAPPGPL